MAVDTSPIILRISWWSLSKHGEAIFGIPGSCRWISAGCRSSWTHFCWLLHPCVKHLLTMGDFIIMAFNWDWLSDGLCGGARLPFVYAGAFITVIPNMLWLCLKIVAYSSSFLSQIVFCVLLRQMSLYSNIEGRKIVYWLSNIGISSSTCIICKVSFADRSIAQSWPSHSRLDQRDMLRWHGGTGFYCWNG